MKSSPTKSSSSSKRESGSSPKFFAEATIVRSPAKKLANLIREGSLLVDEQITGDLYSNGGNAACAMGAAYLAVKNGK